MILLLLVFDLLHCANAATFSLVVPDGVLSGQLGSSVVLPCTVSPPLDCKSYEVRWYRPKDQDNPILLYKYQKVQENTGDPRYWNRVSLIGELEKGNVSLKLENLTLADRGEYVCFVNNYKWYEEASVFLNLPVVGFPPVLSFAEAGEQVNVTCASDGWSPNTTLTWRDKEGRELRNSVDQYRADSEGLVSVSSWLLFSPSESEWISCSVGLSDQEMKEGRVLPLKPAYKPDSGVSTGWTALIIALVISLLLLVLMTVFIFRENIFPKLSQKESPSTGPLEEEQHPLVADLSPPSCPVCAVREINRTDGDTQTSAAPETANKETSTETPGEFKPPPSGAPQTSESKPPPSSDGASQTSDWETMRKHKVAIKPGPSDPKGVLFKERIRSGQYFWIVTGLPAQTTQSLNNTNQNPTLWYVGVTNQTVLREPNLPLTPQNGYWVLQYDKDKGYYVNDSSQIQTVSVKGQFTNVGVFLDCEKHTLSFYNCQNELHLYTFYNVPSSPTSPLIPVIYPGLKQKYKLEICNVDCVNCDELYL